MCSDKATKKVSLQDGLLHTNDVLKMVLKHVEWVWVAIYSCQYVKEIQIPN